MTLNRIDHFVITTKNLCQCLHFYVDILGMEHKIQREENDQHTLHFGNQKINIHTYVGEFQPTAKHAERGCADFCLEILLKLLLTSKRQLLICRGDGKGS